MSEQANQPLGDVTFTHQWYRRFLQRLLAAGYEFRTFSDSIDDGDVLLRHDIDLSVDRAVEMARIEAEMGIESTYFVLLTSPLYNPLEADCREALNEIASLGHDVALHFSTHLYWTEADSPSPSTLEQHVGVERAILDTAVPTADVMSFHRPPSWVLDRSFDGFESAYAPEFFSDIGYVADSTQRWRDEPPEMADLPGTFQLLTHPGLWAEEDGTFDDRVEEAIASACTHAGRTARQEFVSGGADV
jgi:peptidoglycan/xylan/chitin deacetylase (PgdA/CDA1 family)